MKRFRKICSAVLCMAVTLSVAGFSASAADGVSDTQTGTSVAYAAGKYYDKLADAFSAVGTEGVVKLVSDATVDIVINVKAGSTVTLDLGAYRITPSEKCKSGKLLRNCGTLTITGEAEGAIDVIGKTPDWCAIENRDGHLEIASGNIIGNMWGIRLIGGTAEISGGEVRAVADSSQTCALLVSKAQAQVSGNAKIISADTAAEVYGGSLTVSEDAALSGEFGVVLFNNTQENTSDAEHAELTMTGGTIEATYGFALSGNNTQSAQCSAEITGGVLKSIEDGTGIYWPMEGDLTIGGDAVVEGGTGIEMKMGTLTVQDEAQIKGSGVWSEDKPYNGGSQAEGSAILVSAQMYGENAGQYISNPNLTVRILGGVLTSAKGNAVTVYNTEDTPTQTAEVSVTGGEFNAADGRTDVKVIVPAGDNATELKKENNTNSFVTSKSNTTVTVSADAALAVVDKDGETAYYADVNEALKANTGDADELRVYVLGNSQVGSEALESEKVKLIAADGVELKVTSAVEDMIVQETVNEDGSKTYELVSAEQFANPEVTLSADRTEVEAGETILLTAKAIHEEDGVTYSYAWYKDGKLIEGAQADTLKVTESGSYTVKVTAHKSAEGVTLNSAEVESAAVRCTVLAAEEPTDSTDTGVPGNWAAVLLAASAGMLAVLTALKRKKA